MRKVFFSIMYGQNIQKLEKSSYQSPDFDLHDQKFLFPLTYVIANNLKAGEDALILTSVEKGDGSDNNCKRNYRRYQEEVQKVAAAKGAQVHFEEIWTEDEYNIFTGKKFFRDLNEKLQDGDQLYADITFGIKIFSVTSFIALTFVTRAAKDVSMEHLIYAWKYSTTYQKKREQNNQEEISTIYDVTSLFYLNEIAGQLNQGNRASVSRILGL